MQKFLFIILIFLHLSPALAKTLSKSELFYQNAENRNFVKSGTPLLFQLLNNDGATSAAFRAVYNESSRPSANVYTDSDKGHFRAHYDTTGADAPDLTDSDKNGVPDYIDSTLVYLEYAYAIDIKLAYGAPKSDNGLGGSNAVDVYIEDLAPQKYYGVTYPDGSSSLASSYSSCLVLDNNYTDAVFPTKGYPALQVTSAHELFHVIHYSYYGGSDSVWWMEESAVWMEDYAWDDVNDYINYTDSYLQNRDTPLDTTDSTVYGASLFAFFLAKKYGPDTIRSIWSTFKDHRSASIDLLNTAIPDTDGLPSVIADLGVWLYFTGLRANPADFLKDSALFNRTVTPSASFSSVPAADSLTFQHCTFKYVDISPTNGFASNDSLSFEFNERNGGLWKKEVILYNSPTDYEVNKLNGSPSLVIVPKYYKKAVLVIANGSTDYQQYRLVYTIKQGFTPTEVPVAMYLNQNFPNPFNSETSITYYVPKESHIKLRVVNLAGQTVSVLADRVDQKGRYTVSFNASGVSSGQYFIVLESGATLITRKMLYLK
ncbi:MAG: MXAN_6640 family putative metalloprotease [Candidatus Latescibacterota bacterium]